MTLSRRLRSIVITPSAMSSRPISLNAELNCVSDRISCFGLRDDAALNEGRNERSLIPGELRKFAVLPSSSSSSRALDHRWRARMAPAVLSQLPARRCRRRVIGDAKRDASSCATGPINNRPGPSLPPSKVYRAANSRDNIALSPTPVPCAGHSRNCKVHVRIRRRAGTRPGYTVRPVGPTDKKHVLVKRRGRERERDYGSYPHFLHFVAC